MSSKFCLSAIHLLFVLLLSVIGGLLCAISHIGSIRLFAVNLLQNHAQTFFTVGMVFLSCAFTTFIGFYLMHRRTFLQIKMKPDRLSIDRAVVQEYLQGYWKEIFPKRAVATEVIFHHNGKLEVIADLPLDRVKEPEVLLHRIQNELGVLLARRLGYEKELLLTLN